jgi:hypothetical protein
MPVPTFGSAITWRAWFRLLGSALLRSTIISILSWYISIFKEFDLRFSPTNWDNKLSDAEKAGNSSSVA